VSAVSFCEVVVANLLSPMPSPQAPAPDLGERIAEAFSALSELKALDRRPTRSSDLQD
jgi:hypothetical protein